MGLAAILPIHAFYTSEGRAYSLLLLIGTLALNSIVKAIKSNQTADWVTFSVLATLGLHTHYLFALFVALTLSVAFVQLRSIKAVISGAAILVMIAPMVYLWAPCDFKFQQDWYYRVHFGLGELAFTYGSYFLGFSLGPSLRELHSLWVRDAIPIVAPWAAITLASLTGLICVSRNRIPLKKETPVLIVIAAAPCLMGMLCSAAGVGYQVRYSIWSIVPCVVLLAWLARHAWYHWVGKVGTIAMVLMFAMAIFNRHSNDRYRNADLGSTAAFIQKTSEATNSPIIVVSGYMAEPLRYYLDDAKWQVEGIPMDAAREDREMEFSKIVQRSATHSPTGWLVYTREFHEDQDGVLIEKLRDAGTLEQVREFAGVKLYRVTFGS
jgi:hypothetical protein